MRGTAAQRRRERLRRLNRQAAAAAGEIDPQAVAPETADDGAAPGEEPEAIPEETTILDPEDIEELEQLINDVFRNEPRGRR